LNGFAGALGGYKVGREDSTGWLAIEFDAKKFEQLCDNQPTFAALVTGWREHGCIRRPHLKFTEDDTALRPKPPPEAEVQGGVAEKSLLAKQNDMREAMGVAGLARLQREQQIDAFARWSKWVVPGLIAGGILLSIFAYCRVQTALQSGDIQKNLREQR